MSPEQFPNGNSGPEFIPDPKLEVKDSSSDFNPDGKLEVKDRKMMGKFTNWSEKGFGILGLDTGGTIFCPADALCEHLKPLGQQLVEGVEEVMEVDGKELKVKHEVKVELVSTEDTEKGLRATEVCCEDHDKK